MKTKYITNVEICNIINANFGEMHPAKGRQQRKIMLGTESGKAC